MNLTVNLIMNLTVNLRIKTVFFNYMESNSVWQHHALLGFNLCQSRRHQTCLQYKKNINI